MRLTERQKEITAIVRENGPITGEQIAERLHVTRSALRGDLAVLLSGEVIAARRRLGYYYLGGGEDPAAMGRENLQSMPISMVMTSKSKMIFAEPKDSMVDVAKKLIDYEIDCLPVITIEDEGGSKKYVLHGRLSKTNITRLFLELGKGKDK